MYWRNLSIHCLAYSLPLFKFTTMIALWRYGPSGMLPWAGSGVSHALRSETSKENLEGRKTGTIKRVLVSTFMHIFKMLQKLWILPLLTNTLMFLHSPTQTPLFSKSFSCLVITYASLVFQ